MNIHKLLESLEAKRTRLDAAISEIRQALANTHTRQKSSEILETIKPLKRKYSKRMTTAKPEKKGFRYKPGTHWMQKPENRARVQALARKMHKAKNGKK